MEILGLIIIFSALLSITDSVRRWQARRLIDKMVFFPSQDLTAMEEADLMRRVLSRPDGKKVSLIIYWADTQRLLTYMERKAMEQEGEIVSLTPHEVLLADRSSRKVVVKRMGDPAIPKFLD